MTHNFVNDRQYSKELLTKYPAKCVYNAFKATNIPNVKKSQLYNRYVDLEPCSITPFFRMVDALRDETDQNVELPAYVIDEITDAITAFNICPTLLRMEVKDDDHYSLHVQYLKARRHVKKEPKTVVELEYTFPKSMRKFDGYFSSNLASEERLPKYEIVPKEGGSLLRITYPYNKEHKSTLDVTIQVGRTKRVEDLHWKEPPMMELKHIVVARSLFAAITLRLFPTVNFFQKFRRDIVIQWAVQRFHDHMSVSSIDELPYASQLNERSRVILFTKITKYPFLTEDGTIDNDKVFLYHEWTSYFNKELTPEHAKKMELSYKTQQNLSYNCFKSPTKYEHLTTNLFPMLMSMVSYHDYKERLAKLMAAKDLRDEDDLDVEDFVCLNSIKSKLPVKSRYFARPNKDIDAGLPITCETGDQLVKRIKLNNEQISLVDEINHFYASGQYDNDPSFARLISEGVTLAEKETLKPSSLQKRFQSYQFSSDYRTEPTKEDCLAVRYASTYTDGNAQVPAVPDDFFDRFKDDGEAAAQGDKMTAPQDRLCVACREKARTHIFTACLHLCVCEYCSLQMLACPMCRKPGNPKKVFF